MTCSSIKVTFATEASTCQCLQGQTFSGSSIWLMQLSVRIDLIVLQPSPGQFGAEIYMDYLKYYFYTTVKLVILFIKPQVCETNIPHPGSSPKTNKRQTQSKLSLTSLFIFFHYFYLYWNSYSVSSGPLFFFFSGFCHLTHLNKITKNDFMLYNPPGGHSYWLHQGAIRQLWSNTVWGSSILTKFLLHALRTHLTTCWAENQRSCMDVNAVFKCPSVYLTLIQSNTPDIIAAAITTNEQWHKED